MSGVRDAEILSLETERLILRRLTPAVYEALFTNSPDETLKNFFALDDAALAEEKKKFRKGLTMFNKSFCFFQLLDKASGKVIGGCGFHTWYLQHARAEIGYAITEASFKNRRLMREAMKEVIAYGFREMKLHRIEAFIGRDNEASLRLVRGFGFTPEGCLRDHYFKNGRIEDSLVFSLLEHEFKP